MPNDPFHGTHAPADRDRRTSRWTIAALMVGVIALFYILREHWAHALGLLPYVLLLACPLMHLFHGGHGHHGGRPSSSSDGNDPHRHGK